MHRAEAQPDELAHCAPDHGRRHFNTVSQFTTNTEKTTTARHVGPEVMEQDVDCSGEQQAETPHDPRPRQVRHALSQHSQLQAQRSMMWSCPCRPAAHYPHLAPPCAAQSTYGVSRPLHEPPRCIDQPLCHAPNARRQCVANTSDCTRSRRDSFLPSSRCIDACHGLGRPQLDGGRTGPATASRQCHDQDDDGDEEKGQWEKVPLREEVWPEAEEDDADCDLDKGVDARPRHENGAGH